MATQEKLKTRNERCTCLSGRDYDGSEFGPCAYCEEREWLAMQARIGSARQPATGPWTAIPLKDDAHRIETVAGAPVANVPVMDRSDHHANNAARAAANARLIAAAPELYAALATVERIVLEQRCERGTHWDLACTTIAEKVREHAAAALAKARGGSA